MKNVMHSTGDLAGRFGGATADAARRVGGGTVHLARKVGPKRGIAGLVVIGAAAIGGVYLIRYLRARRAEAEAGGEEIAVEKRGKRGKRNAAHRNGVTELH